MSNESRSTDISKTSSPKSQRQQRIYSTTLSHGCAEQIEQLRGELGGALGPATTSSVLRYLVKLGLKQVEESR